MNDLYARTNNICLVFLAIVAGAATLKYMQPVLIPLIFAVFLYSILSPMVKKLQDKARLPKALAVIISILLLFFLLTFTVLVLVNSAEHFVKGAPKYSESIDSFIVFIETQLERFQIDLDLNNLKRSLTAPLLNQAQRLTGQFLSFFGNLFLVFIFCIFMLSGESKTGKKPAFLQEVLDKISSYVSFKTLLSLTTGFVVWLILLAFNVEMAFVFAALTVLFNFIPTIGSILAVTLPLPIVFLQYQFGSEFWLVLALTGVTQFTIGNVIEPKIMGDSMDLHPITVLISLIFWGMIWGIAGMFLAVPTTALLKIAFSRLEATKEFSEILAGRFSS